MLHTGVLFRVLLGIHSRQITLLPLDIIGLVIASLLSVVGWRHDLLELSRDHDASDSACFLHLIKRYNLSLSTMICTTSYVGQGLLAHVGRTRHI